MYMYAFCGQYIVPPLPPPSPPFPPTCDFLTQELQEENIELKEHIEQMRVKLLDQEWTNEVSELRQTDQPQSMLDRKCS